MRQILDLPKWESALPFIDIGPVPGEVCAPRPGTDRWSVADRRAMEAMNE